MSKDLLWRGPIDISGLGRTCRDYIRAVHEFTDINLRVINSSTSPTLTKPGLMKDDWALYKELKGNHVSLAGKAVQQVFPWQLTFTGMAEELAHTVYESDGYHPKKAHAINRTMDRLLVPTEFNKGTLGGEGLVSVPIDILPIGIDMRKYQDLEPLPEIQKAAEGRTIFLTVADLTWRKGFDILLEAFWEAFPKDEAILVAKMFHGDDSARNQHDIAMNISRKFQKHRTRRRRKANVVLLGNFFPEEEMRRLYASCDAFVSTTRGEGWGIPMMEAMALGKPTVAPNWGGQLAYMNPENSFLIPIEGMDPIKDKHLLKIEPWYEGQSFCRPSQHQAATLMRQIHKFPELGKGKGAKAREDIQAGHDLPVIARKIEEVIFNEEPTGPS